MKLPFSVNKNLFALLILIYPLHILSETNEKIDDKCLSSVDDPSCLNLNKSQVDIQPLTKEDKVDSIPPKAELNSLSQFGIIDYASAVKWCRKQISENYNYEMQLERIDIHPADFCRTYFNPSIQSKTGKICMECDLDPYRILANLFEAIKQPQNFNGSYKNITKEAYLEGKYTPPTLVPSNSKSNSDQSKGNSRNNLDQSKENSKNNLYKYKNNRRGAYLTGSIGLSKINDIDVQNIISNIEFDTGLGVDLGIGYDFGQNRFEASWLMGQSDGVSWLGYSIESDSKIDSILVSYYYDFRDNKKWSPFIGLSIGSANVDIDGVEDCGFVSVTGTFDNWSGWGANTEGQLDGLTTNEQTTPYKLDNVVGCLSGSYDGNTYDIRGQIKRVLIGKSPKSIPVSAITKSNG